MMRARQGGQAMVEAAVILGMVVLLFLCIFYLGKFHDVQASTIQAARYAAWERVAHSEGTLSDVRVQNQARARLFTWNRDPFKSTDGLANGSSWTRQSAVWHDHAGRQRLVERPDDVTISTVAGPLPGRAAGTVTSAIEGLSGFLDGITGGEALPKEGMVSSTVAVRLDNLRALPAPLNALNLTLREQSSVVLESWDASGPRQAALRSRTFTLAGPLAEIDGVLGPIKGALSLIEPAFDDLHFGQVCPDIVPGDRVQGNVAVRPAYRGGGACVR